MHQQMQNTLYEQRKKKEESQKKCVAGRHDYTFVKSRHQTP